MPDVSHTSMMSPLTRWVSTTALGLVCATPLFAQEADTSQTSGIMGGIAGVIQGMDDDTSGQDDIPQEGAVALPDETETRLDAAVAICFEGSGNLPEDTRVTVHLKLNDGGEIDGIPSWTHDNSVDPNERRLYMQALMALDSCAPYDAVAEPGEYELTFAPQTVESLRVLWDEDSVEDTMEEEHVAETETETESEVETDAEAEVATADETVAPVLTNATQAEEKALKLKRAEIAELQARLGLLGYDPNGIDGSAGRGTRAAIKGWQGGQGLEANGYLNASQVDAIQSHSEEDYQIWLSDAANAKKLKAASTPRSTNGVVRVGKYWRGRDGCLRTQPDNRRSTIIIGRSTYCNKRALGLK